MSIGCAATFRDEHNALPGFLEMASAFFSNILLVDCSMDMSPSTDGSLDIIRAWGLPDPPRWNLSAGFGAIRSQLIHTSPTDWTVIMDIDERMPVCLPVLDCHGDESYPKVEHPRLSVSVREPCYNQRDLLKQKIAQAESSGATSVRFARRHWFDASFTKPTQNWMLIRDYQLRCIKGRVNVGYKTDVRMHERAYDFNRNADPVYIEDDQYKGPFFEHLHCHFKPMEPEQRMADIKAYDELHYSDVHTPIPKQ